MAKKKAKKKKPSYRSKSWYVKIGRKGGLAAARKRRAKKSSRKKRK